ncbi:hypothetical protein TRFO_17562 [Tritrichomonas foetus]|uniref:Uncharacterized protein n=1 Tax=Tritrichomonas foetus TaxID=1144522 RepID=A0A1J4KMR0_9EUKA|nr:hypothetical protein TRFO_17562 [Tritrichomonas foetus]|eukprot:OHT12523.1 hypothetical protein TRFO_17562 [Tritrichomonas foetus]
MNESDSLSKTLPSNLAQFIPDPAHQRKTQISFAPGVVIPPQTHEFRYNPTEKADHQKCPITPEDRKIYDDLAVKLADESILAAIDEVKKKEGGEDSLLVPNE